VLGAGVGLALVAIVVLVLVPRRDVLDSATPTAVMVLVVVVAAVVGGLLAAVITAVAAGLALNLAFIEPYGTLKVRALEDGVGLAAFLAVALVVGVLVSVLSLWRREGEGRQAELKARNDELQALLAERDRLLQEERRAQELERLGAERSTLLRSVSHDLRTPLSAIRAIADDLRVDVYDTATRDELLTTVCDEADRLDRMVSNLLNMSRIEAGNLAPGHQAVDVRELVQHRLQALRGLLEPYEVAVRIPDDLPFVDGDELQLEQVMTNLLANAVRHTPKGSDIWVVASASEGSVRIEVSDRGPGIPASEHERVFLPFQRGEGSRSSGVGLAICKAVVEAHGGRIWIESRFGGGATVAFTVPALCVPDEVST
jgi:K+-sensing histidine kinase KdpD